MSIRVDQFEEDIHLLITERGKEYFDSHQVLMLKQTADGWTAVIEGTDAYQVLLVGHDVISNWQCTCPFEHGPVCKHVAAVLYAVREQIHANRASSSGEIDRWIDEADPDVLRRILKIEVRKHEEVMASVYHEFVKREL
ncbi:MAG: SWIM zinc finger family protein [Bacteroidota bacterium]|nr:SWIM zinc finger family protein [Bacteroidota bacterium]